MTILNYFADYDDALYKLISYQKMICARNELWKK